MEGGVDDDATILSFTKFDMDVTIDTCAFINGVQRPIVWTATSGTEAIFEFDGKERGRIPYPGFDEGELLRQQQYRFQGQIVLENYHTLYIYTISLDETTEASIARAFTISKQERGQLVGFNSEGLVFLTANEPSVYIKHYDDYCRQTRINLAQLLIENPEDTYDDEDRRDVRCTENYFYCLDGEKGAVIYAHKGSPSIVRTIDCHFYFNNVLNGADFIVVYDDDVEYMSVIDFPTEKEFFFKPSFPAELSTPLVHIHVVKGHWRVLIKESMTAKWYQATFDTYTDQQPVQRQLELKTITLKTLRSKLTAMTRTLHLRKRAVESVESEKAPARILAKLASVEERIEECRDTATTWREAEEKNVKEHTNRRTIFDANISNLERRESKIDLLIIAFVLRLVAIVSISSILDSINQSQTTKSISTCNIKEEVAALKKSMECSKKVIEINEDRLLLLRKLMQSRQGCSIDYV